MNDVLRALREGELVLVPTDTVFGIAGDARNPTAVQRLLDFKKTRGEKPLPVMVASSAMAAPLVLLSPLARSLMTAHWPGALTLVLPCRAEFPAPITAGTGTLGIRVPDHPELLALLRAFDGPLVVSSANPSGRPPPRTAAEAHRAAPNLFLLPGDAGQKEPSTVLSLIGPPLVLRPGPIPPP